MLCSSDISHGYEILRIYVERIYHRKGYQVPPENGQNMLRKQACDMTGEFVTPCGELTTSKDREDAQFVQRIDPNTKIGTS